MAEKEFYHKAESSRVPRTQSRAPQPPGPMMQRPSAIPPPPLPVAQPSPKIPTPQADEECVTKRFYVDVFHPVNAAGTVDSGMLDPAGAVDSIQISAGELPPSGTRAMPSSIDEDAVTKEIRIRRIGGGISNKRSGNITAMKVRALPTDDTLWKTKTSAGRDKNAPNRDPGFLHKALSSARNAAKKVADAFSTHSPSLARRAAGIKHTSPKSDKPRIRLSVNSYTRDLYQEIRNALNPEEQAGNVPMLDNTAFSVAVSEPPKIAVNALLLRRADKHSLLIRGRASHPIAIRDIMVFADKKKILYLSNAMRESAGYMEFSADVPLLSAVSSILVVARHDDHVMGSQSLVIKKRN